MFSQSGLVKDTVNYKLKIIQDNRIEQLNRTYTSLYQMEGYRIQIYSGNKKQPARQARLEFTQLYRDVKAHESYQQPYFKVRVGDFRTKLEALKFQKEVQVHFPNCYIVKDGIEVEELLK
ncbi:MAG: SPOR domain-containing protein [Vicingus serpentipes]|nr:SPOR domain-containing protein [Vicingus serpentipes]